jgi:predicted O-linked N-acetylglucosamine transferase (SPINDLY family)
LSAAIVFAPRVPLNEYFGRFDQVDVALDTVPYSGCTTTFDTLWMGVPVVTLPGSRSVSRYTASILSALGLEEWIASTPEEYVRLAVELAQDQARLTGHRVSLRDRMLKSPLMDEPQFARDMEAAYRRVWRAWCRETAP